MLTSILYPLFAMVALTFTVMPYMLYLRVNAVKKGSVDASHFYLYKNTQELPRALQQVARHYTNLFEAPVLFYTVSLLALSVAGDGSTTSILGWLYVGCRLLHTIIHLGSNNLLLRMVSFIGSMVVLAVLWINVGLACTQAVG